MASFVDTNVLLYAASTTPEEAGKRSTARAILKRDDLVLSAQVLQEFYVQATRATKPDRLPHQRQRRERRPLRQVRRCCVTWRATTCGGFCR